MKSGRKPTRNQRKFIEAHRLDAANWLVVKDTPSEMVLSHRHSDATTKVIQKEA